MLSHEPRRRPRAVLSKVSPEPESESGVNLFLHTNFEVLIIESYLLHRCSFLPCIPSWHPVETSLQARFSIRNIHISMIHRRRLGLGRSISDFGILKFGETSRSCNNKSATFKLDRDVELALATTQLPHEASFRTHTTLSVVIMESQEAQVSKSLPTLDSTVPHAFVIPAKRINEGRDVQRFLTSEAYRDIGTFVMQLNIAMCPRKSSQSGQVETWQLDSPLSLSEPVRKLQELLKSIDSMIAEAPPDTGPRRFGNVSFRKWYEILETRVRGLLQSYLPKAVLEFSSTSTDGVSVLDELTPYLLGCFGSPQRLDYGTGHELSFLAFVACIWKLGGFTSDTSAEGAVERRIVLGVFEP